MPRSYIICTTPRSGSTLLCTLLEATGRAGCPDSFYHDPHFMQEWADAWGLAGVRHGSGYTDRAYLEAAVIAGTGATSRFGMRLQQPYLAPLQATLSQIFPDARSDAVRFERAFGQLRYFHLTRENKVAQAVSLVRARQSGLWHRNADGSERERLAPDSAPVYDPAAIAAEVSFLTQADQAWSDWFARERIEPLHIAYETLARSPATIVQSICAALDVDPPAVTAITPAVAQLADTINEEWIVRYRIDTQRDRAAADAG